MNVSNEIKQAQELLGSLQIHLDSLKYELAEKQKCILYLENKIDLCPQTRNGKHLPTDSYGQVHCVACDKPMNEV